MLNRLESLGLRINFAMHYQLTTIIIVLLLHFGVNYVASVGLERGLLALMTYHGVSLNVVMTSGRC